MQAPAEEGRVTKSVLVTGAARGIGRRIAVDFARDGYAVALVDTNFEGFREFSSGDEPCSIFDELKQYGVPVLSAQASTTNRSAMENLATQIGGEWGALGAVVCNAGGGSGPLIGNRASAIDLDQLEDVMRRNLFGTIITVIAALPALKRAQGASIVTMGSITGIEPNPKGAYAHYGTTKAAVMHYTRLLANDLAPDGIRVNCVAPGPIATGRARQRISERSADEQSQLLARLGTAQDVADAVRFLVSPAASHISGQTINLWRPTIGR